MNSPQSHEDILSEELDLWSRLMQFYPEPREWPEDVGLFLTDAVQWGRRRKILSRSSYARVFQRVVQDGPREQEDYIPWIESRITELEAELNLTTEEREL